ncbi:MAG: RloB family protein [Propionibacteriaceae bacterium]|nr:RloB family protein [Propionibacteriaceae bacterium]
MSRNPVRGSARRPYRERAKKFLVVCEGQTEKAYFEYVGRALHGVVDIKQCGDSSPVAIVKLAARYARDDPVLGLGRDRYDEVWAVFDWDGRTDEVLEAKRIAAKSGVQCALSNPSFEVWLLWHWRDYMRIGCAQNDVLRELQAVWGQYHKGLQTDFAQLPRDGRVKACDRSENAVRAHENAGRRYPEDRPSSEVFELIGKIVAAYEASRSSPCPLDPRPT